jgi:phosphoserine/homoserine phosphotransferase
MASIGNLSVTDWNALMNSFLPPLLATDLEGILLPEIWIAVAERTGIAQLRLTTRDIADYDQLMQMRLGILDEHQLRIQDIQQVIAEMDVLPGAQDFLAWAQARVPMIIITDSFYELLAPFLPKLNYATIFAHRLETDADGRVVNYRLRTTDGKRKTLHALRELGFRTLAVGDSYNDIGMLEAADRGVLYRPSANVVRDHPQFPVTVAYDQLQTHIERFLVGAASQAQAD